MPPKGSNMSSNVIKLSDHFNYKRLLRFVYPSIIMMIFTSIYGVVDGVFVSNFCTDTEFAALNLIFPFIMFISGTGFMIGAGGSALVSQVLGTGDNQKANRYFSMLVIFTIILGAILTAVGIVFMRPAALLLGATEDMVEPCVTYGTTLMSFAILFMLQNVFQSFLNVAEKPKLGLAFTVIAGVTNAVLDWLFMAVFHMGLVGAALASGIGQCLGGILPLIYFLSKNSSLLRLTPAKLELKPILKTCTNGSSELMSNISSSLVGMLFNKQLMTYLGQDGVSAYGVLMYVQFIFIAAFIGYSTGCAPIIGFHYGAEDTPELKSLFKKSEIMMGLAGLIMTAFGFIFAWPLSKLFVGSNPELCQMTHDAFMIYSTSYLVVGFNIFASGFFTALGNGAISAITSFSRTLVFQAAAILLLPIIIGPDGIWWAVPISELGAFMMSSIFIIAKRKKYGYM